MCAVRACDCRGAKTRAEGLPATIPRGRSASAPVSAHATSDIAAGESSVPLRLTCQAVTAAAGPSYGASVRLFLKTRRPKNYREPNDFLGQSTDATSARVSPHASAHAPSSSSSLVVVFSSVRPSLAFASAPTHPRVPDDRTKWPPSPRSTFPPRSAHPRASRAPPAGTSPRDPTIPRAPISSIRPISLDSIARRRDRERARAEPSLPGAVHHRTTRPRRARARSRGADEDLPSPTHARSATSLRCDAASKGIQGDGRVKLCVSKEEFDAAQASAGENLVRPRMRDTHLSLLPPHIPLRSDGRTAERPGLADPPPPPRSVFAAST